ncbi:MAG: DUF1801 domain-containing protein [Myxococcota bacterium]
MKPIESPEVAAAFGAYPPRIRRKLLALRKLIFDTAAKTEGVGALDETLKWGEPAYLPKKARVGTTIRVHWNESAPREYAMCFHCQTDLVQRFRDWFPGEFQFDGNRRLVFDEGDAVPRQALAVCVAAALTYHRDKRRAS